MKATFGFLIILCGLIAGMPSCQKRSDAEPDPTVIHRTLKANEVYQFDAGVFGDEDGCIINRQATHYSVSTLERNLPNPDRMSYKYVPAANFVGTDEVEIKMLKGWPGPNEGHTHITYTKIAFTITN